MSNYPPGVTGNEDAFGPQHEQDVTIDAACYNCPFEGDVVATRLTWQFATVDYWDCPQCGTENEAEIEPYNPFEED